MIVKFKKLEAHAFLPVQSTAGAAGIDLANIGHIDCGHGVLEYDTGIAVEIPPGYVGLLFPRSSISNTGLRMCNSVGVIDSDYRGSIKVRFYNDGANNRYYHGDRIAQLIILPFPQVELQQVYELSDTARGTGAFGSTGN
jgi:dUTP pyrophosphatase